MQTNEFQRNSEEFIENLKENCNFLSTSKENLMKTNLQPQQIELGVWGCFQAVWSPADNPGQLWADPKGIW